MYRFLIAFLLVPAMAFADTETIICGNCFVTSKGGSTTWDNPTNAHADDANFATASGKFKGGAFMQWLDCEMGSGNTFSVSGTIDGVLVEAEATDSQGPSAGDADDDGIHLIVTGTAQANDESEAVDGWPAGEETLIMDWGGATDVWGGGLTASKINADDFGIRIGVAQAENVFAEPAINYVKITVYYTPAAGGTNAQAMGLHIID